MCVRKLYHPPTLLLLEHLLAPEASPTRLQGGRQVNEKLSILPLYPRRWREVTLILPNFVFLPFLMPRPFSGHIGSSGAGTREAGSMWAVMLSAALNEGIKGGQWRWGWTEGAVNPGPTLLSSFRGREGSLGRRTSEAHFICFIQSRNSCSLTVPSSTGVD